MYGEEFEVDGRIFKQLQRTNKKKTAPRPEVKNIIWTRQQKLNLP